MESRDQHLSSTSGGPNNSETRMPSEPHIIGRSPQQTTPHKAHKDSHKIKKPPPPSELSTMKRRRSSTSTLKTSRTLFKGSLANPRPSPTSSSSTSSSSPSEENKLKLDGSLPSLFKIYQESRNFTIPSPSSSDVFSPYHSLHEHYGELIFPTPALQYGTLSNQQNVERTKTFRGQSQVPQPQLPSQFNNVQVKRSLTDVPSNLSSCFPSPSSSNVLSRHHNLRENYSRPTSPVVQYWTLPNQQNGARQIRREADVTKGKEMGSKVKWTRKTTFPREAEPQSLLYAFNDVSEERFIDVPSKPSFPSSYSSNALPLENYGGPISPIRQYGTLSKEKNVTAKSEEKLM